MKSFVSVSLIMILTAGCVQTTGNYIAETNIEKTKFSQKTQEFEILDVFWDYEINKTDDGECLVTNVGRASASVRCKEKNLFCNVFVNGTKIDYGINERQECDERIIRILEYQGKTRTNETFWYTRFDQTKEIKICCSNLNKYEEYQKENEVCKETILEKFCI